jgi:hypothetical protein
MTPGCIEKHSTICIGSVLTLALGLGNMPTLDQLQTLNQFGSANATSNTTHRTTDSQSMDKALVPAEKKYLE